MDYYDDRKIILEYEPIKFGPKIFIPEITGSHFNITTDKHHSLWASISLICAPQMPLYSIFTNTCPGNNSSGGITSSTINGVLLLTRIAAFI